MIVKAYELVPVLEKINVGSATEKGKITCFDVSGTNLYIGTFNGFIIHIAIELKKSDSSKPSFHTKLQRHKNYKLLKPIDQIICCSSLGYILFLCDKNVYNASMYGLEIRSSQALFKGVTCIARNTNPKVFQYDEVQICVATRRKIIQIYNLTKDKIQLLKEITLPESTKVVAMDSQTICTTFGRQYCLVNYITLLIQDLFLCEPDTQQAVKLIGDEEFLLNGPTENMGVTVTKDGLSKRQPFTWPDGFRSVAFDFPYVLVLGETTVTVHSLLDQRQKQAMSFIGGELIENCDGHVFIATDNSVMAYVPVPFSKQIQMLLVDKRVDEAFDLLSVATSLNPNDYNELYVQQIKAQAGFVYFSDANFNKALDYFADCELDPREIICLYPLMMPASKTFTPSRPLLHNIQDLTEVVKKSKSVFADAKKFLLKYLELCRNNALFTDIKMEIDTVLMKLYADCNHSKLLEFVSNQNSCYSDEVLSWLTQYKRYHALALYFSYLNQPKNAIGIWHKLIHKTIEDKSFPGTDFVIDFVSELNDRSLIFETFAWLLKTNQEKAVNVVIRRDDVEFFKPEQVCDILQKYVIALRIYLEYIVYEKNIMKEQFHTHLAILYVNNVIKLMTDAIVVPEEVEESRIKLQTLLETSNHYRVSSILQKVSKHPLHKEIAILYGKLDQHDKALKILVYNLQDFEAAERYCDVISQGKTTTFRENVFFTLLNVYLNPLPEDNVRSEHFHIPAVKFLNSKAIEFDALRVLNILPNDWSVDLLSSFLIKALRKSLSTQRQSKVELNLSKQFYLETKGEQSIVQRGLVHIKEDRLCDLCKKPFVEATCQRYPNGVVVHCHCATSKSVCPVTGKSFA